jgi:hypothetical protein
VRRAAQLARLRGQLAASGVLLNLMSARVRGWRVVLRVWVCGGGAGGAGAGCGGDRAGQRHTTLLQACKATHTHTAQRGPVANHAPPTPGTAHLRRHVLRQAQHNQVAKLVGRRDGVVVERRHGRDVARVQVVREAVELVVGLVVAEKVQRLLRARGGCVSRGGAAWAGRVSWVRASVRGWHTRQEARHGPAAGAPTATDQATAAHTCTSAT